MVEVAQLLAMLTVLMLPFQLLGLAAYFKLVKSNVRRAHIAGALIPALTFFVVFAALLMWRYYNPGMLMLAEGAINLIILVVLVIGTALHLVGGSGATVHFILYRKRIAA